MRVPDFAPVPRALHPGYGSSDLRRLGDRGFLQHEVVAHQIERVFERLAVRRLAAGELLELDDERLLHAVNHVGVDVAIAALEQWVTMR